jgi:Ycf66 protein N-terminus
VGFGTPVALLIGIILILVAVGLFFLDKFKPGYKRDSDTVYAVLFLTVGIMSLVNWSQNFLESFQLMILAGMLIALVLESIQRRTPQSKQVGTIYRDEERERPSRGSYRSGMEESPRAELRVELDDDRFTPIDELSRPRRIRGTGERGSSRDSSSRDPYAARSDEWNEGYAADRLMDETQSSRRSGRRSSGYEDESQYTNEGQGRSSRRRPLQLEGDAKDSYSDPYATDVESSSRRRGTSSPSTDSSLPEDNFASSSRSRRRRPRSNNGDRPTDETYVDYKPIKPSNYPGDGEFDNSNNFDDDPKFN